MSVRPIYLLVHTSSHLPDIEDLHLTCQWAGRQGINASQEKCRAHDVGPRGKQWPSSQQSCLWSSMAICAGQSACWTALRAAAAIGPPTPSRVDAWATPPKVMEGYDQESSVSSDPRRTLKHINMYWACKIECKTWQIPKKEKRHPPPVCAKTLTCLLPSGSKLPPRRIQPHVHCCRA